MLIASYFYFDFLPISNIELKMKPYIKATLRPLNS